MHTTRPLGIWKDPSLQAGDQVFDEKRVFWKMTAGGLPGDSSFWSVMCCTSFCLISTRTFNAQSAHDIDKTDKLGVPYGSYVVRWTIDIFNAAGSLCDLSHINGINVAMNCIGGELMYLGFHIEDESSTTISYLENGAPKVWYVYPPRAVYIFKTTGFRYVLNMDYLND